MPDAIELQEQPEAKELNMILGWRQWADAGSTSSELPRYLIQQTGAKKIGSLDSGDFYLFQIPGTHDLVRPTVKFKEGYPESLSSHKNELFYAGNAERGTLFFLGDEPHMNAERYVSAILNTAESLKVKRIVGLAGVYGEFPYDKERNVSCIYSLKSLKAEFNKLAVSLSMYHGGASIGSYLCKRAGERNMEYVGFYAFVPTFDFSKFSQIGTTLRIQEDYMAWLGVMRRVKHMLHLDIDLKTLERRSEGLVDTLNQKVKELANLAPQIELEKYLEEISENFTETLFEPLDDVWEEELRRIFDDDEDESGDAG